MSEELELLDEINKSEKRMSHDEEVRWAYYNANNYFKLDKQGNKEMFLHGQCKEDAPTNGAYVQAVQFFEDPKSFLAKYAKLDELETRISPEQQNKEVKAIIEIREFLEKWNTVGKKTKK